MGRIGWLVGLEDTYRKLLIIVLADPEKTIVDMIFFF
jgi:hypothetical protein